MDVFVVVRDVLDDFCVFYYDVFDLFVKPLTEAQYAEKLKKTAQMGADQGDLNKLKKDFGK